MSRPFPRLRPLSLARAHVLPADPNRQCLIDQILLAESQEAIDAAREAQRQWLVQNPDDFGMLEAGARLAYAEEALDGDQVTYRQADA